jgi:hypothetical protein
MAFGMRLDLLHHLLEALFEIAAIACAGEQRAHVEGKDCRIREHIRNIAGDDLAGEPLGDRGLADAGVTDQQWIVLLPAAQDLDGPLDLRLTPDQGIDAPVPGLLVQINAIGVQGVPLLLALTFRLIVVGGPAVVFLVGATGANDFQTIPAALRCHG